MENEKEDVRVPLDGPGVVSGVDIVYDSAMYHSMRV